MVSRQKGWFLSLVLSLLVYDACQSQSHIYDSLNSLFQKESNASRRVDLLNDMAYSLYDFDDTIAFERAEEALALAEKIDYPKGLKQSYVMVGLGYFSRGEFREAITYYNRALRVEAEGSAKSQAYIFQMLGKLNFELANYDSSLFYYSKAGKVPGAEGDKLIQSNVYRNIAQVMLAQWRSEEAFDYLKRAEELLIEAGKKDDYMMTEIWSLLGIYYENKLQFEESSIFYDKMCALADRGKDYYHLIKCQLNQADLAFREGDFARSLNYAAKALEMSESYTYPPQLVEIYFKFGEVYAELSQHELATRYLFEGLKISERLGLKNSTARIFATLAWIYYERNNLDQAYDYISKSLVIREEIGDQRGIGNCQNVRGLLMLNEGNLSGAMKQFELAKSIWTAIDHQEGIAAIYYNQSLVLEKQGHYQQAMEYLQQVVELEKRVGNEKNLGTTYNQIANLYITMGRLRDAEKFANEGLQLANESKSIIQKRTIYSVFSKLYQAKGEYKKALEAQLIYNRLNDSIFLETGAVKLAEMEALYRIEQKDQKIKLLSQEARIRENEITLKRIQLKQQQSITAVSFVGIALISVLAFAIYRFNRNLTKANRSILEQKEEIQAQAEELTESNTLLSQLNREITEKNEEIQAQSEELIEANQTISQINKTLEDKIELRTTDLKQAYKELDTFFYRSSHDFRRPITTFLGLAEVAKITVKDANALELFEKVQETASNLDKMLVKLQSISDVGAQQLIYREVLLEALVEEIKDSFRGEIDRKGILLECAIQLKTPFHSYPALVKIILENLIENAIFFCGADQPRVMIEVFHEGKDVTIQVRDNGQGIDEEVQGRIFDMYFRGNERSKGNGLGLYIVKKSVEKLQGSISFETKLHVGSTFTVRLPNELA